MAAGQVTTRGLAFEEHHHGDALSVPPSTGIVQRIGVVEADYRLDGRQLRRTRPLSISREVEECPRWFKHAALHPELREGAVVSNEDGVLAHVLFDGA